MIDSPWPATIVLCVLIIFAGIATVSKHWSNSDNTKLQELEHRIEQLENQNVQQQLHTLERPGINAGTTLVERP